MYTFFGSKINNESNSNEFLSGNLNTQRTKKPKTKNKYLAIETMFPSV